MNKLDFMNVIKDILEETDNEDIKSRGEELKHIIDSMVELENQYYIAGLR